MSNSPYLITPPKLKANLLNNEPIELVDVRTLEKHQEYNIGGKHIPSDELPQRFQELNKDKLVVTYCTTGGRSMRALEYLLSAGFRNVKSLDGGVTAWKTIIGE